jgi:hypothetical protein
MRGKKEHFPAGVWMSMTRPPENAEGTASRSFAPACRTFITIYFYYRRKTPELE